MFRFGSFICIALLTCACVEAQDAAAPLGIFEGQSDVGNVLHPGSAQYDARTQTYTVSGSGDNMWFANDEFHFVWKKLSASDVTLTAGISILGSDGDGHRKALLMIRQSLDPNSAYVDAARHGDGLTSLQFRESKGATTCEIESDVSGPARLRIEKQGNRFYMWIANENEPLQFAGGSAKIEMRAPFYVGIGVCAHNKDAMQRAAFTNVDLETSVHHPAASYSTVETVLQSGDVRVGYVSREHLKSPGWTADGRALTFEIGGKRRHTPFVPLKTAAPVGPPVVRAPNAPPRLSPDAKFLLLFSHQGADAELRVRSLADKTTKTLAQFVGGQGSLGPQPWSPDGRRVVFISYQKMTSR
jgi:hypothetical protein